MKGPDGAVMSNLINIHNTYIHNTYMCVCFLSIYSGHQGRGHIVGRSHRISHAPSFCGACLNFSREKASSAVPFPRRA